MGGGAAMRAASKVAGVGAGVIHHGGLRGATVVPPVEQSVRNPSIPVSAILTSSSQTAKATAADVAGIQRQVWEINDWEFAGGEDDMVMGPGEPLPRVVFDAVPSFQEAKEATVELKDALDKSPTVPNHAFKAFKLLSTSPEAQNVVASIASDRNVWNAVLQNPVLKDFMDSNQSIAEFQEPVFAESFENSSDWSEAAKGGNWLMGVLKNVKLSVTEMVSNLSGYFQSIFGPSPDTKGDAKATFVDMSLGASFMGLATLAVMVILLRRI
ncbi:uncharacterized protein LOC133782539 isoform X2 [Humulus lupulus]|uniref:uncharacterized protein LOC133782539 isoform X2 n=1 Tax=Humulus lupulus TaxID=3486 RepID=UPI002B410FC9|nr:uncharacterized protein LOC133782539 isoform X2 [Humulus lupulus]